MSDSPASTRWAQAGDAVRSYGETFARLVESGQDVVGEARLADALAPRGARILDVGSGMGRIAAALAERGHEVTAIEPDAELVAQSRRTYLELDVEETDVLAFDTEERFDLVVLVGNVMVYLAEGTERAVLSKVRSLLAPGGRALIGFHLTGGPSTARVYPVAEFVADVEASGLVVEHRFGTYELHPANEEYAVWVLSPVAR